MTARKPDTVDVIAAVFMLIAFSGAVTIWVAQGVWLDPEFTADSFWGAILLAWSAPFGAYLIRAFCRPRPERVSMTAKVHVPVTPELHDDFNPPSALLRSDTADPDCHCDRRHRGTCR